MADWKAAVPGRSVVCVDPAVTEVQRAEPGAPARCPAMPGVCPAGPRRRHPGPDAAMHRILAIPDGPATVGEDAAHRIFNVSIALSAGRCLLSYVVLPVLAPLIGTAAGLTAAIGVPVAVLALVFDVLGIRRFWLAGHRWRWPMTGVYLAVIGMVTSLLVGDLVRLT